MAMILKELYDIPERLVITAHRGFSGKFPENTIPAFLAAVEIGSDIIEFDVRGTKDGVPIILHDETFERTANQPGKPSEYLLSEIKKFDASFWHGTHCDGEKLTEPAMPGVKTPTLEEMLQQVGNNIGFNIQIYDASPHILKSICDIYHEFDLYERGYLTVADYEVAKCIKALNATIEICVLNRQGQMTIAALHEQKEFGCRYIQPLRNDVTEEFCHAAREMELYANMFYSNTKEDNRKFIDTGIQGILSDCPDILVEDR